MSSEDYVSADSDNVEILTLNFCFVEVVEYACSITSLQTGEIVEGVSKDMDTYSIRQPLGVCAGISPFNFPAMIPLWVNLNLNLL